MKVEGLLGPKHRGSPCLPGLRAPLLGLSSIMWAAMADCHIPGGFEALSRSVPTLSIPHPVLQPHPWPSLKGSSVYTATLAPACPRTSV